MRPQGEVRRALAAAAAQLHTPTRAPTARELADHAGVARGAARVAVRNMVEAGVLRVVRTRRVAYRSRPVAEYELTDAADARRAPRRHTHAPHAPLAAVLRAWAGSPV